MENTQAAIKVQVFKSSVIISGRNTWKQRSTSSCLWRWTPTSNVENCESAPMRQIFRDGFMTISLACLLNVVVKTYQTQMQVMVLTTKSIHFTRTPLLSKGCVWYCSITPFIQPLWGSAYMACSIPCSLEGRHSVAIWLLSHLRCYFRFSVPS